MARAVNEERVVCICRDEWNHEFNSNLNRSRAPWAVVNRTWIRPGSAWPRDRPKAMDQICYRRDSVEQEKLWRNGETVTCFVQTAEQW